jgi:hypothetical protein
MLVERQEGTIWFLCDSCADSLDTEETDFSEAVATMRGAGWNAQRVGEPGDWLHRCPECRGEKANAG